MPKRKDRNVLREEALRPSRYLGYDRYRLALHLLEKEVETLAEQELRRAIWLNPFEPLFPLHLAVCLFRQERLDEAEAVLAGVPEAGKCADQRAQVLDLIRRRRAARGGGG